LSDVDKLTIKTGNVLQDLEDQHVFFFKKWIACRVHEDCAIKLYSGSYVPTSMLYPLISTLFMFLLSQTFVWAKTTTKPVWHQL